MFVVTNLYVLPDLHVLETVISLYSAVEPRLVIFISSVYGCLNLGRGTKYEVFGAGKRYE